MASWHTILGVLVDRESAEIDSSSNAINSKKRKAATLIQAIWRARMARRRMDRILDFPQFPAWDVDSVLTGAAVRLQCVIRMSQARRRYLKRTLETKTRRPGN